jgi:hypothetical protein
MAGRRAVLAVGAADGRSSRRECPVAYRLSVGSDVVLELVVVVEVGAAQCECSRRATPAVR